MILSGSFKIIGSDHNIEGIFTAPGSFSNLNLKLPGRKMRAARGSPLTLSWLPSKFNSASNYRRLSSSGQVPVLDAVGLICGSAETGLSVRLIFRVVSLKPDHLAVPLKRKPMGGDTVEEPAVMADDYGTACKILQRLFQGAHGVYVQIIGRFIEQKDIGLFLQHTGQMDAVSFTSGQHRNLLLLITP